MLPGSSAASRVKGDDALAFVMVEAELDAVKVYATSGFVERRAYRTGNTTRIAMEFSRRLHGSTISTSSRSNRNTIYRIIRISTVVNLEDFQMYWLERRSPKNSLIVL